MSLADIATTVKRDLVVPRPSWSGTLACADEHAANYGCCFQLRSIGHEFTPPLVLAMPKLVNFADHCPAKSHKNLVTAKAGLSLAMGMGPCKASWLEILTLQLPNNQLGFRIASFDPKKK
ncbi:uncharacterized protein PGTG_18592 [Puccinia graminis f. sp. tritici CRL 75-36-700-3]|uniref:Uncharacterized protein n=1 Tax=Puccinia graminis f. sp. tritici (strain CRL 75-36-700-3 / race SCCL) TaxID=418459 RepID=E3L8D8_PUCGT|nr:uncharacterized protein PGTG_18592 [Puccinia graminis f. sp. tritici CRL 75-36-700-3]EFP92813.1 hypothetical protein PGTG_18592 [Puccinia graminis f. sp. tritici CRL 75-36-700-3]